MKYNIATVCWPNDFESYLKHVRNACPQGTTLQGYVVVPGPGCYNHGVMLSGPDSETLVHQLTMLLQPARYSLTPDSDPGVEEGVFTCCPRNPQE